MLSGRVAPVRAGQLTSLLAVGFLFLTPARALAATESQVPAPTPISVSSTEPWTATGITVQAGDEVRISAEGLMQFGSGSIASVDPNGVPWGPDCEAVLGATNAGWTAPGLPCWSLLARVEPSAPVAIGGEGEFQAATSGPLFLGINDNQLIDNAGAWTATVTVIPPSVQAPLDDTTGSADTGGGIGGLFPVLLTLGVLAAGVAIWGFASRHRRDLAAPADMGPVPMVMVPDDEISLDESDRMVPTAGQLTVVPAPEDTIDVNIFAVQIVDGHVLRVGYNYFPESTEVRWRIKQNAIELTSGDFVTNGGGSTYHYVMLPFDAELSPAPADVEFEWTIDAVPFNYAVRREPIA